MTIHHATRQPPVWISAKDADFATFRAQVEQSTDPATVPRASEVVCNIPIYEGAFVETCATSTDAGRDLMAEWARVFAHGAGIIVIRQAVHDHAVIDRASDVFDAVIAHEKAAAMGGGDHFAKPGANDRIWNSLEKHCLADPENFARYYGASALAMAALAWIGPDYQMTAQVNRVNPGGAAQTAHRDYHLGFMTPSRMEDYPSHIHHVSPMLTLQGALAHCDMPLETGPTLFLPFSQLFFEGYLAYTEAPYQDYFAQHHVQLPLKKGDAVFFNPAVMHGAGRNVTEDRFRLVNLFQISSAFGRAMESVNRDAMVRALYPALSGMAPDIRRNAVAAAAEGYAFPTNLDRNPPIGGLAPKSQAALMLHALEEDLDTARFAAMMDDLVWKNKS
ncbi:phytanoyl-CoA dioxygenase family protein [Thioclava sp. GXIMD2076]|uniref:phytanoyl-CoA dioxygenase family protein n=1 Tax=Thioclava sp. GXIMD2076 TaxID=3131931 RepID=UPI0030CDB369